MSSDGGVGAPVHFVTVHPYVIEVFTVARSNTVTFSSSRDVVINMKCRKQIYRADKPSKMCKLTAL